MERRIMIIMALLVLVACESPSTNAPSIGSITSEATSSDSTNIELDTQLCAGELPDDALLVEDYYQLSVCEWPVHMHVDLYNDDKAKQVFDTLRLDLAVIQSILSEHNLADLRSVNIWLELDNPVAPGGVYHPSKEWLALNGHPIKWAKGVQLGIAENYINWREEQPGMVLHELAHAYDDQYFNNAQPDLLAAYELAKQAGIYEAVAAVDPGRGLVKAYALSNSKEYFAELTEAYFLVNDFFPFNRDQLQSHDVAGFNAIKTMWGQP